MNQQSIDITACDCFTLNSQLVASVSVNILTCIILGRYDLPNTYCVLLRNIVLWYLLNV